MGGARVRKVFLAAEIADDGTGMGSMAASGAGSAPGRLGAIYGALLPKFGGVLDKNGGAGFVASFDDASQALAVAIETIQGLEEANGLAGGRLRAAIHEGPVYEAPDTESARGMRYVGAAPEIAERLLALAYPNQVLLGRAAFNSARLRYLPDRQGPLQWIFHGAYLIRGVEEPVEIGEAGPEGIAPLRAPEPTEGIERHPGLGGDSIGWRPAAGEVVPGRPEWRLDRLLGRGGSGEAWVARHIELGGARAFKFAFSARHAKMLKRELTLGRLIRAKLGERREFQRHLGRHLDGAPYYLEMDYEAAGDLRQWFEGLGRHTPPLDVRLAILSRLAVTMSLAHSIGVIHRDLKPSNVLVRQAQPGGAPEVALADFGVGELNDRRQLLAEGITAAGFTGNEIEADLRPGPGTLLYMAPELLAGRTATVQSDIYALGVIAYQFLIGDFGRPVAPGWEADISDPLLREDVARCLDRAPARRWSSAAELAKSLDGYVERTQARWKSDAKERRQARLDRTNRLLMGGLAVALALGAMTGLFFWGERQQAEQEAKLRGLAEKALADANEAIQKSRYEEYSARVSAAAGLIDVNRRFEALDTLALAPPERRAWEWGRLARRAVTEAGFLHGHASNVRIARFSPDGRWILTADNTGEARIWEAATGRLARGTRLGSTKLLDAWIDPTSSRAVAVSEEGSGRVIDLRRGVEIELRGHAKAINRARFDPSGLRVATASDDHTAKIWDAATGSVIATLSGHQDWVVDIAYSPDGRTIATSSDDGSVRIWSSDGEPLRVLNGGSGPVNVLAFSPDGRWLITAGDDTIIRQWDAATGAMAAERRGHDRSVRALLWLDGGNRFASMGLDPWVFVWKSDPKEQPITLNDASFWPTGMGEGKSPTSLITVARDGACRVWDIESGRQTWKGIVAPGTVDGMDVAPGEFPLIAVPDGPLVRLCRLPPVSAEARVNNEDRTTSIDINSDETAVVTGNEQGSVTVWTLGREKQDRIFSPVKDKPIMSVKFSRDGRRVIAGSGSGAGLLINLAEENPAPLHLPHGSVVRSAAFLQRGTLAATAGEDGAVKIWRADTGEQVWASPAARDWRIVVQELSDESGFFTAARSGEMELYAFNARDAAPSLLTRWRVSLAPDPVDAALIDPAGRQVAAAAGSGRGLVWDVANQAKTCEFGPAGGGLMDLDFSPDSRRILAVYHRGSLQVINARTGRLMLTEAIGGEESGSDAIAISPRSGIAAVGVFGSGTKLLFVAPWGEPPPNAGGIAAIYGHARIWNVLPVEQREPF